VISGTINAMNTKRYQLLAIVGLVALSSTFTACIEEILLIDPAVTFSQSNEPPVTGEISITLGMYQEQFFDELNEGDDLPIIFGLQGGTWVMPAIRCTGMAVSVEVTASVVTENGEDVGILPADGMRLLPQPDGSLHIEAIPIPIGHPGTASNDPFDYLYGQNAILTISVVDSGGRRAEAHIDVVLTSG